MFSPTLPTLKVLVFLHQIDHLTPLGWLSQLLNILQPRCYGSTPSAATANPTYSNHHCMTKHTNTPSANYELPGKSIGRWPQRQLSTDGVILRQGPTMLGGDLTSLKQWGFEQIICTEQGLQSAITAI